MSTNKKSFLIFKFKDRGVESDVEQEIEKEDVWLDNDKWEQNKMKHICPLIREWKLQQLTLSCNNNKYILNQIQNIRFPNIKQLYVPLNRIQSIEGISKIYMPTLQLLSISANNLAHLNTIRKVYWPKINHIYFSKNMINDGRQLCELGCRKLDKIIVQGLYKDSQQCYDISWVCKLQSRTLQHLQVYSEQRIHRQPLYKTIKRKYALQRRKINISYK